MKQTETSNSGWLRRLVRRLGLTWKAYCETQNRHHWHGNDMMWVVGVIFFPIIITIMFILVENKDA
jgi:hypothetical protein